MGIKLGGIAGAIANAAKGKAGEVTGSSFPADTYLQFRKEEGEPAIRFVLPNKEEVVVTHDKVKCATVLAMGVIDIDHNSSKNITTSIYGTKYLVVLKDGRQAVLTVGLGEAQYFVERVLF